MKKTLMVLSFALCASFAFAQTHSTIVSSRAVNAKASVQIQNTDQQEAGYNGSIFAKAEGDVLHTWNFGGENQDYTTGQLTASDVVDGVNAFAHTQTAPHSTWHRLTDTTASYLSGLTQTYPATFGQLTWTKPFQIRSSSPTNGYMLMTMCDQISAWGGTGATGAFNAYIALGSFSTENVPLVDVRLYEYYRKFNSDQCWIDYSTNNSTWSAVEINVKNIDVAVNDFAHGWLRVTMPLSIVNQSNVYLRVRWSCPADGNNGGGAYGYFWAIDDVQAIEGPANRLSAISNEYFEGFYQLMPQGLEVPMVWNATIRNSGGNTQTNITGSLYTSETLNGTFVNAGSVTVGSIAATEDTSVLIDPKGFYALNGFGYCTDDPTANPSVGPTSILPTTTLGRHFVYGDISTTVFNHVGDSVTFDTIGYNVTAINPSNSSAVWGRDNGVLTKFNSWIYGMVGQHTFSTDPEEVAWYATGYGVCNSYITSDNVPAGWRIKGVQLVAATEEGMVDANVEISAILLKDSVVTSGTSHSVWFNTVETGANAYSVQPTDLNNVSTLEYLTEGNYNVVNIMFPEQPVLQANSAYRIGYRMNEDGNFCVSGNRNYYYTLADSTGVAFRNTEAMKEYAHMANPDNRFATLITDPAFPDESGSTSRFLQIDNYPMIRMLVGPYEYQPQVPVSFECGDNGEIYDASFSNSLCGLTDSVTANSTHTYTFAAAEGYVVDQVFVNGELDYTAEEAYENLSLSFPIAEATTIRCTFKEGTESIDPVAKNVAMTLQPNPATSNVQLTISGVEGNVDFALIDMSGRVIRSAKINAETAQTISLNGLAKGAYFVRITNNTFSKVEKLIVR